MIEVIRLFVFNDLNNREMIQTGLMQPRASSFRSVLNQVMKEVFKAQ